MTDAALRALREFLDAAVARGLAPGVVAGVVDTSRELFLGAAGKGDVANDAPLAPDAIFRIASMTKPVTSLAVMMLEDDGVISVDDAAATYLPELARVRVLTSFDEHTGEWQSRPPARPITIRDLLTHTSGIVYSFLDARLAKIDDGTKPRADLPLLHDPGDRFSYGPGTEVLSWIVDKAARQSVDDFCRSRIFEPLGMNDTGYAVPPEKRERVVTMQTHEAHGFVERPNPTTIESRARGHDGLFSTASDYGKFIRLFLNRGTSDGRRLVSEAAVARMMSNQLGAPPIGLQPAAPGAIATPFPIGGEKDAFGFGFQIETPPSRTGGRSPGTCSWSGIFNTYFWIDPARQIGVTILMQFLPAHDAGAMEIVEGVERRVYSHGEWGLGAGG
jgi:CubicO group peptidase (beta-lactamase class C family)